jgi:hypothetical protein
MLRRKENLMTLGYNKRAVGTFPTYAAAETALHDLRDNNFPMDRVSVVGRNMDADDEMGGASVGDRLSTASERAHGDTQADEGAKTGALAGGAFGGLTGLLVGLGAVAIPGIGPVMLGGALATALATTLSGGAIGAAAGSVAGALAGLGIPDDRAKVYGDRLSRGEYLVMVEGSEAEIHQANLLLSHQGIEEWGSYDVPTRS